MSFQRVYFERSGKIVGRDNNDDPSMPFDYVELSPDISIDFKKQMIDPNTLELRDMTNAEFKLFNIPSIVQIRRIRDIELNSSDWRETQPEWTSYRQALRDITKAGDAAAMIAAWPLRPDGSDALRALKAVTE